MNQTKVLGAEKQRSVGIKPVEANDKIILFSTLNIDNKPTISFIGYTMVDTTYEDKKSLYNKYKAKKKLKLKGMKYFINPIIAKDLADELSFIKNPKKSSAYLKSEYKEINKDDFKKILKKSNITKEFPAYFEELTFVMDEFIFYSINSLYYTLKNTSSNKQIEILTFIRLLTNILRQYGVTKSYDEVKEFYSKNAWKQGFNHKTSRDPDKLVDLYSSTGKKRGFSYITLE